MKNNTLISKNLPDKTIKVTHQFAAPVAKVWKAWTESSILDKWWAPKPWRAETISMDFSEGGFWLYCMAGPDGERSYCRVGFKTIDPQHRFTYTSNFCDEQGNTDNSFPTMHWLVVFEDTATSSKVDVTLTFDTDADLQKIVAMGFEGGFTMGLGNLDELLESQS